MPGPRPDDGNPVTRALNGIFSDYLAKRGSAAGGFDRDVRDPAIILNAAADRGLIPAGDRVITVTGSKGKGTVARAAAQALLGLTARDADAFGAPRRHSPDDGPGTGRVGLIVSPNEVTQTDRLRLDGVPIADDDFLTAYRSLEPDLDRLRRALPPSRYLSPFGAFLLIGLQWFRDIGTDWVVLEGGRGAAFDEVGRIPARVSIVTTVAPEHREQLGPTLADIARDKLAIAETAGLCLLGPDMPEILERVGVALPPNALTFDPAWVDPADTGLPRWLAVDRALGRRAAALLAAPGPAGNLLSADPSIAGRPLPPHSAGSFGITELTLGQKGPTVELVYDATGRPEALDTIWYQRKRKGWRNPVVIACLSDQKDPDGMTDLLTSIGLPTYFVILSDAAMHGFARIREQWPERIVATIDYDDEGAVRRTVERLVAAGNHDAVVCLGIQPFIRLVRRLTGAAT